MEYVENKPRVVTSFRVYGVDDEDAVRIVNKAGYDIVGFRPPQAGDKIVSYFYAGKAYIENAIDKDLLDGVPYFIVRPAFKPLRVTFEETGEVRCAKNGEYYSSGCLGEPINNITHNIEDTTCNKHRIFKKV